MSTQTECGHDFDIDEGATYQRYVLTTAHNGSISGYTETNDPEDRGFPHGYDRWDVEYRDRATMERVTGKSHVGCIGCVVTVFLDGQKI